MKFEKNRAIENRSRNNTENSFEEDKNHKV